MLTSSPNDTPSVVPVPLDDPTPSDSSLANFSRNLDGAGEDAKARGKAVNDALEIISELAPEYAAIIDDAALRVRRQYKRTQESDHKRVIFAMERGATTLDELKEDTDIPKRDLKIILEQLIMIDRVEIRTTRDGHHKSGRGGTCHYYYLVNSAAFSKNIGKPKDVE